MRNNMELGWFYSPRQIARYIPSRVTSLKPPRSKLRNPWHIIRSLDKHQWAMFGVGFAGWTWDAFDFFTVSLCLTAIAADFDKEPSAVSWGITVTLMLRSVGALISGTFSDRYGRKYIMIANLCLFIVFELGSSFCHDLSSFLAVRALYGISMGGLLAPAAATALEDLPYDARGIASGLFQQGYAVGYLLAAIFYRALVPTTVHGWRSLFWFGSAVPILIIAWRLYLPETNHYQVIKAEREARHAQGLERSRGAALKAFLKDANKAMRQNWFLFVYLVVLMAGMNSVSHGSQDLFPTFLLDQVNFGPTNVTIVTVIGQIGAIIGSTIIGYCSTFTGRRLAMMVACVFGGAIVPAYIFPRNLDIIASTFFEQFFVGGVWGPIPVVLMELSPIALRTFFYGFTYQLGNLASAASSTIEATIGERFPLPPLHGEQRYNYGKVIGIFLGAVWCYILVFVFLGPEMTQEERDEEAALVYEYEQMRAQGVSLAEIGAGRVKIEKVDGEIVAQHIDDIESHEHSPVERGDEIHEQEKQHV